MKLFHYSSRRPLQLATPYRCLLYPSITSSSSILGASLPASSIILIPSTTSASALSRALPLPLSPLFLCSPSSIRYSTPLLGLMLPVIVASRIFWGTRFVLMIGEGCAAVFEPVPDREPRGAGKW